MLGERSAFCPHDALLPKLAASPLPWQNAKTRVALLVTGAWVMGPAARATGRHFAQHVAMLHLRDLVTCRFGGILRALQARDALQSKALANHVLHVLMLQLGESHCNLQIGGTLWVLIQATKLLVTASYWVHITMLS